LRQGWERYLAAKDDTAKQHQLAELSNALEIACAICIERVFVGVSHELLAEYLDDVMRILEGNDDAKRRLEALIHSATTFKYIVRYIQMKPNRTST